MNCGAAVHAYRGNLIAEEIAELIAGRRWHILCFDPQEAFPHSVDLAIPSASLSNGVATKLSPSSSTTWLCTESYLLVLNEAINALILVNNQPSS